MDDHVRRRLTALLLVVPLVAAACAAAPAPTSRIVELALRTTPPEPPGEVACPMALLADVVLDVDPSRPEPIVAVSADGTRTRLVFRGGTRAAWDPATGVLLLQAPEGRQIQVPPGGRISFGGGFTFPGDDELFFACTIEG
jgi:hypothetical protein